MIRYFVHRGGRTETVDRLDPAWLLPDSGAVVWADLQEPTEAEGRVLRDTFGFHELAVESAMQSEQHPKIESYDSYLYVVLHGINFDPEHHRFDTHDTDFFLGSSFLVSIHDGRRRSIAHVFDLCGRSGHILAEGPVSLLHRIVDTCLPDHHGGCPPQSGDVAVNALQHIARGLAACALVVDVENLSRKPPVQLDIEPCGVGRKRTRCATASSR